MKRREAPGQTPENRTTRKPRRLSGGVAVALVAVLIVVGFFTAYYFSRYINQQLFLERQTHLVEITDKISEVIDSIIDSSWGKVYTCAELLQEEEMENGDRLMSQLEGMTQYVQDESSILLAFDQEAAYYTSDGHTGHWGDPSMFSAAADDRQVVVAAPPYMNADETYMVFIQRLESPVTLNESQRTITHIAVAAKTEVLKEALEVSAFSDQCHTFIVNSEGRRLYKQHAGDEFITGYNILTALEQYEFINGGTIDDLRTAVGNETQACLEFKYGDENYYVGTALVPSVLWEVMLFVPTDVLGANTDAILSLTIQFFVIIGGVMLVLLCVALVAATSSLNDKKMMRQQQASNILLTKAAEKAEAASRAKSEFLSHMSHDIRTPINGIMGMTDIAAKHLDDKEKAQDCLKKIDTASRHLLSLVNDVLDMSSIESGKAALGHQPMRLGAVLNNCVSIISGQLTKRELTFHTEFKEFTHQAVLGDELRLRQVFINMLGNSVKFTPDGGSISFFAEETGSDGDKARFKFIIEDTGKGMDESFLKHIFEPFSQEDGTDRSTYQGTGLGMAITKQFVDLMGGTITAESQLGKGSRFTLEIPFDIQKGADKQAAQDTIDTNLAGMNILLVEDNDLNMEISTYLLEERQINVTAAKNGQEAVDIFSSAPGGSFDAILMDIMMPIMDGIQATRTIRAMQRSDARQIPIIAMTANAYEEDKVKTREAGMDEHLSKPIDSKLLFSTLAYYYGKADAEDNR